MDIKIDRNSKIPVYLQISDAIEEMICQRRLVKGYKLPPERQLAEDLQVNRNTVVKAYGELIANGRVVSSRQKPKGYFVEAPKDTSGFNQRFFPLEKAIRYEFNRHEKQFMDIFWNSDSQENISFGGIIMDKKINPVRGLDDALQNIFRHSEDGEIQAYLEETERLKENICKSLSDYNLHIHPRNIQIVAETNQAISYLMTLYVREGECIVTEEPIVPDTTSVFRNKGINIITVPMEEDGMDLTALERSIRKYRPKFIYTQPNFHNPTGITMSLEKRMRLLEIANQYNIPIIEEDYQRDFNYTDTEIPSLYVLDQTKSVVYLYSYTLIFPYGIKIGYAAGPSDLIEMLGNVLIVEETLLSNMGQYLLNEYIDRGYLLRHIEIVKGHYKKKCNLLCQELDKLRDKGITYIKPKGGILLWCTLPKDINERALFSIAREKGILYMPGWIFYPNGNDGNGHIRICFSNVSDTEIVEGVRLLGEALDMYRKTGGDNE